MEPYKSAISKIDMWPWLIKGKLVYIIKETPSGAYVTTGKYGPSVFIKKEDLDFIP